MPEWSQACLCQTSVLGLWRGLHTRWMLGGLHTRWTLGSGRILGFQL